MNLSFSAGQKYLQCPKAYYFYYIRKLRPTQRRSPLTFGDAIDEGLNALLLGADGKKAFIKTWDKYKPLVTKYSISDCDGDEDLISLVKSDPFGDETQKKVWESLQTKGLVILEDYQDVVIPKLKRVLSVQERISVKNKEGDTFNGVVDVVAQTLDGEVVVFDNKTTSVTYKEDSVRTSEQLSIYYALLKEKYNLTKAGYIVINKKLRKRAKPPTNISIIVDDISDELIDETFQTYDLILNGIKDGNFERDLNGCITKYGRCDYYDYCHNNSMENLIENDNKKST